MAEQISNATARLELILGHERLARLESAYVMVLGLGGVGSNCVEALARGGISHFVLVDADTVEASNLNRQAIAFTHTLGQRKTDATRNLILDINPAAEVKTLDAFLLKDNTSTLLDTLPCPDVLVDAIDTVSAKLAAACWAQERGVYFISSMGGANKIHPEL
ncbi:MAG: ThiF family adenylyltransferase, partial [Lancefieldella rimae]